MERYEQVLKRGSLEEMWRRQLALTGKSAYVAAFNTAPNKQTLERELEDSVMKEIFPARM